MNVHTFQLLGSDFSNTCDDTAVPGVFLATLISLFSIDTPARAVMCLGVLWVSQLHYSIKGCFNNMKSKSHSELTSSFVFWQV